jgi:putative nucleotidyltransferase with HDIG domain
MIEINSIINEIQELDPLPPTIIKLFELMSDEQSTVDEIVQVLQYDLALTAFVLKYANSVFSASQRKIVSLKDAVIRIGAARILEHLTGNHLQPKLKSAMPTYGYNEGDLWRHSVAAATAAEMISSCTTVKISGASFTAALLHDIGKLIIGRVVPPEEMQRVWEMIIQYPTACTGEMAEKKVLGFSHADIGGHIAAAWHLPQPIVNAIRDHHGMSTDDTVTDTVKICNVVARALGEGLGNEGMSLFIDESVAQRMHLTRESFEMLCAKTACRFKDVLAMFDT